MSSFIQSELLCESPCVPNCYRNVGAAQCFLESGDRARQVWRGKRDYRKVCKFWHVAFGPH